MEIAEATLERDFKSSDCEYLLYAVSKCQGSRHKEIFAAGLFGGPEGHIVRIAGAIVGDRANQRRC
jgi:hypothetical protein